MLEYIAWEKTVKEAGANHDQIYSWNAENEPLTVRIEYINEIWSLFAMAIPYLHPDSPSRLRNCSAQYFWIRGELSYDLSPQEEPSNLPEFQFLDEFMVTNVYDDKSEEPIEITIIGCDTGCYRKVVPLKETWIWFGDHRFSADKYHESLMIRINRRCHITIRGIVYADNYRPEKNNSIQLTDYGFLPKDLV